MSRFRFVRCLGRGGMGEVWEVWRRIGDVGEERVAVKRIVTERVQDARARELFRREGEIALGLAHSAIVKVVDLVCEDGELMIVMEYVDGLSVEALSGEPLGFESVRRILRTTLEALAYLHERGIIHRDITPRNVMVSKDGDVKVTDFGLARWLAAARSDDGVKGTAAFSSPEQLMGEALDERADLYAVAAVGYALLTMCPPYGGGDDREQIKARMMAGPVAPLADEVPADLRRVIESMLTSRDRRPFGTAAAMRDAIEVPAGGVDVLAETVAGAMASIAAFDTAGETETQPRRRAQPTPRRRRGLRLAAAALAVGAVAIVLRERGTDAPATAVEHDRAMASESKALVSPEVADEPDPPDAEGEPGEAAEVAEAEAVQDADELAHEAPALRFELDGVARQAARKRSPRPVPATDVADSPVEPVEAADAEEAGDEPGRMQQLTIITDIEAVPALLAGD